MAGLMSQLRIPSQLQPSRIDHSVSVSRFSAGVLRRLRIDGSALTAAADSSSAHGEPIQEKALREMRVVDLQAQLKALGLSKSGIKEVLVQRLHTALNKPESQQPVQEDTPAVSKSDKKNLKSERTPALKVSSEILSSDYDGSQSEHIDPLVDTGSLVLSSDRSSSLSSSPSPDKSSKRLKGKVRGSDVEEKARQQQEIQQNLSLDHLNCHHGENSLQCLDSLSNNVSAGVGEGGQEGNLQQQQQQQLQLQQQQQQLQKQQQGIAPLERSKKSAAVSNLLNKLKGKTPLFEGQSSSEMTDTAAMSDSRTDNGVLQQSRPGPSSLQGSLPQSYVTQTTGPRVRVLTPPEIKEDLGHIKYSSKGCNISALSVSENSTTPSVRAQAHLSPWRLDSQGNVISVDIDPSEWKEQTMPEGLPPMQEYYRGESYGSNLLQMSYSEKMEFVSSNPTGLSLTFLGTSNNQASNFRSQPSVVITRQKDLIIIDCGDDTQRQIGKMPHLKTAKVFRIFITCLSTDCVLGLPGLLCTISSSREQGHEVTDIPLHIFGPPGLTDFLTTILKVSNTYIETDIIVHEFSMSSIPESQSEPRLFNKRSRIWKVVVPPDQLNPKGYIDGDLTTFMPTKGRATQAKGLKARGGVLSFDPRANFIPFEDAQPGDPSRTDIDPLSMTWSIRMDCEGIMTAIPLEASRPTVAYAFREADRGGNLILERAKALGIPPGRAYGLLKEGRPIVTSEDRLVTPDMVMTPTKPGRRLIIMGTCSDAKSLQRHPVTHGADVLVSGALRPKGSVGKQLLQAQEGISELLSSTALGSVAAMLGIRHVLLSRFDWRVHGKNVHPYSDPLLRLMVLQTARMMSPKQRVTAVHDSWIHILDIHQGTELKENSQEDEHRKGNYEIQRKDESIQY